MAPAAKCSAAFRTAIWQLSQAPCHPVSPEADPALCMLPATLPGTRWRMTGSVHAFENAGHPLPSRLLLLQDYLLKWPKTVLIVSHAREFLNSVCSDIIHLHSRKLTMYRGNFEDFEKTASERLKNAKKAAEGQERQRAHMQVCCRRCHYSCCKAGYS